MMKKIDWIFLAISVVFVFGLSFGVQEDGLEAFGRYMTGVVYGYGLCTYLKGKV